jgi:plastocyanin
MRKIIALGASLLLLISSSDVGNADTGTVKILGDEHFVANALIMATFKFAPGPLSAASGATVTWDNSWNGASADEPHTVTIVPQSQLPTSIDQVFQCGAPGTPCGNALAAHFPAPVGGVCPPGSIPGPPEPGAPPCVVLTVNVGAAGLNTAGDSILIFPHATATATISASAGSTLYYLCAIHPWMQGSITVR